jgi:hypothetical protein
MKSRQPDAGGGEWDPEVSAKVRANREAREKVRADNPELFQAISESLFKNDPMGINFNTNTDEYEPEVGTIVPRLQDCTSEQDVLDVVHEEFCAWFDGEATAGPKSNYVDAARDIWDIWRGSKAEQ